MRGNQAAGFCGTAIIPSFSDRPCIAVNGGRNTRIKSMTLFGSNWNWVYSNGLGAYVVPTVDDLNPANWVAPAITSASPNADSRYAPFAAIVIDGYQGIAPTPAYPNVTFPAWSGLSTQYGFARSSETLLDDVEIGGFVVGLAINPSGGDGNGDFTQLRNCLIEMCKYGISIGQTQARLLKVEDSSITNTYTVYTTDTHGLQLGMCQATFINCSFDATINWLKITNSGYGGPVIFRGCYAEVVYSLGTCSGGNTGAPISFDGCSFKIDTVHRGIPKFFLNCGTGLTGGASFNDCMFNAGAGYLGHFHFGGTASLYSFKNCFTTLGSGSAYTKNYECTLQNATGGFTFSDGYTNVNEFHMRHIIYNTNTLAYIGTIVRDNENTYSQRKYGLSLYNKRARVANDFAGGTAPTIETRATLNYIDKAASASLSVTGLVMTLDITGTGLATWQLIINGGEKDDVLIDQETNTVFMITARTGNVLTCQAINNYNYSGALLTTPTQTGYFFAHNLRRYLPYYYLQGDTTSASATIANVARADGYGGWLNSATDGMQAGDYLYLDNTADCTFPNTDLLVSTVTNGSPGSLTMHTTALKTVANKKFEIFIRPATANGT
jgi:hypothetical protein